MDDLRIQIVNYRTKTLLVDCLRTLCWSLGHAEIRFSVAILDNASGDDLSDLPPIFPDLHLEIHQGTTNVGYGAGHNFLAAQKDAGFLFLLNPDTRMLEPRTPQELMRRAEEYRAQVIGPRLVTPYGTTQPWDHGELDGLLARITLATGNSFWRARARAAPAAWVSGAAFMIEKRRFKDLRGFDERFFLYKEEEELCWRLRAAGGTVVYDPGVPVFHHGGVVARKSAHLRKSTDYFLQKHFRHRVGYTVFRLINALLH